MKHWATKHYVARLCILAISTVIGSGCAVHLHRQEYEQLATAAKTTFNEKTDLLGIVRGQRANLAKQRDVELAALRQSQLLERDLVFLNAARMPLPARLSFLQLPLDEAMCEKPLNLHYVARRACELGVPTSEKLAALASAAADPFRSKKRDDLVVEGRRDLQSLGWVEVPSCAGALAQPNQEAAIAVLQLTDEIKQQVKQAFEELVKNCRALAAVHPPASGLQKDLDELQRLKDEQSKTEDAAGKVRVQLEQLAKELASDGKSKPPDRKSIAKQAMKLREALEQASDVATKLGIQEALAGSFLDGVNVLLLALEDKPIPADKLDGAEGADLRRAVVAAQTIPQLAEEVGMIDQLRKAPSRASLLMAQRQALLDRENIALRKAQLAKRVELMRRRIALTIEEAQLLQLATAQSSDTSCTAAIDAKRLPPKDLAMAKAACLRGDTGRQLLGFSLVSRSILGPRSAYEAARLDAAYLQYEQNIAANEYAIKSWNGLIGTPIELLDGYHRTGLKADALADLIFKAGGLGLLGVAVGKVD